MSNRFRIAILLVVAVLMTSACSTLQNSQLTPSIDVQYPEQNRIRFSGKGSGAGMMLMSSMGPMGVAVGVAIDEGIGKDIQSVADAQNIQLTPHIEKAFRDWVSGQETLFGKSVVLKIERYGFITQPGSNDPVTAEIKLQYSSDQSQWTTINFPKDFNGEADIPVAPLDVIKTDGQVIESLFVEALDVLFGNLTQVSGSL
ncbi:MAG: hypothetical protein ACFHVJ_15805 [Aestuariibacter sp.]